MLGRGNKGQSLLGKLLLSSALVAVSVMYGWWQKQSAAGPTMAIAPIPAPPAADSREPARASSTMTAREAFAAPSQQNARLPAPQPVAPLTALAALPMYQPPPAQVPLPLVTGIPAPGAAAPIPPGTHLQDGDYLSDTEQYEWGDLTVKISVHGGQITGVQIVQYPDHRAESLQISQMASPILDSEVIKTQQSKVDVVSSATDTSYVFRDAVASAIVKATR